MLSGFQLFMLFFSPLSFLICRLDKLGSGTLWALKCHVNERPLIHLTLHFNQLHEGCLLTPKHIKKRDDSLQIFYLVFGFNLLFIWIT